MIAKPKTCPFCGSIPEIYPKDHNKSGSSWGKVQCINNECSAGPSVEHYEDFPGLSSDMNSDKCKDAAIMKWNTRY